MQIGKRRQLSMGAFWLVTGAFLLAFANAAAIAGETVEVQVELQNGEFVVKPNTNEIKVGDSIVWVVSTGRHRLQPVSAEDAFETTGDFTKNSPPEDRTRTFNKPGVIHYECFFHDSMQGTITVTEAAKKKE